MANLEYLTRFMPTKWHMNRILEDEDFFNCRSKYKYVWDRRTDKEDDLDKGALGEMQVAAWLNSMTDNNEVIFNKLLVPNSQSSTGDTEIDLIWLGPNGITVIEVKSYSGMVEVFGNDDWYCFSPGSPEDGWKPRDPVGQCIRQVNLLKTYLRENGIVLPIQGLIVMPAIRQIKLKDRPRVHVIKDRDALISYQSKKQSADISSSTLSVLTLTLDKLERA